MPTASEKEINHPIIYRSQSSKPVIDIIKIQTAKSKPPTDYEDDEGEDDDDGAVWKHGVEAFHHVSKTGFSLLCLPTYSPSIAA